MKKKKLYLTIPFILFCIFLGCNRDDQSRIQASWSSKDPILIPLNIRIHQMQFGNLVGNHSFESGKVFYEESNVESFNINGWKKIGENVEWINSSYEKYDDNEVFEGIHSVKITRNIADETEEIGDGILSDYIKVIPGNYFLQLHLKLKDIEPNQSRIGVKMHDAINIRLKYFDKNKIEISGIEYNPFENKRIDNAFKALSFANYNEINEFGWGEVYGRSMHFPFFDGDIPDQARYVKIFIGLKGTGTLWIDNIDFRYTNKNFTQLERIKTYFDSSYSKIDQVYPFPKRIEEKGKIKFYSDDHSTLPIIVVQNQNKKLAQAIQKNIYNLINNSNKRIDINDIKIVSNLKSNHLDSNQFVISIGKSEIYNKNKDLLPDSLLVKTKQSYYIKNLNNTVFIKGKDAKDLENALNTFNQMFDQEYFYKADIFDYPDFTSRNYVIHSFNGNNDQLKSMLDLFKEYKFSEPYFEFTNKQDSLFPNIEFNDIQVLNYFIDLNNTSLDKDLTKKIKNSRVFLKDDCNKVDIEKLINKYNIEIEYLSKYSSLKRIDPNEFETMLYYKNLKNREVGSLNFVWTGGSDYSLSIDKPDCLRIMKLFGECPILLDNSLIDFNLQFRNESIKDYYAGKIRVESLFEPYNLKLHDSFTKGTKKIILETKSLSELNIIRILTTANNYWNMHNYNPDKSLWILLNKLYGKENAINLLYFNDSYYGLVEVCRKIKINGSQYKNQRLAKNFEYDLEKYWNLLNDSNLSDELKKELNDLKDVVMEEYKTIVTINN